MLLVPGQRSVREKEWMVVLKAVGPLGSLKHGGWEEYNLTGWGTRYCLSTKNNMVVTGGKFLDPQ